VTELQQNRYDQLLRRVGGLIGPGSKVSEVISELFPMIDVENLPPELYVLEGTALAFRGTNIVAPAGQQNASQLSNPTGSGKLITVTSITMSLNIQGRANITLLAGLLASSNGFGEFRDSRNEAGGSGAAIGNTRIETGLVINAGTVVQLIGEEPFTLADPNGICVLAPGDQLTIGTVDLARRLVVSYFWRERVAEQSELQF
jgi:hypothetical protein